MSLLTSPTTTKDQLKFLNKMQRHFHRRGASQYIPRAKQKSKSKQKCETPSLGSGIVQKITTKLSSECISAVKGLMEQFMLGVRNVVKSFTMIDHYAVLEILRKHQFFSDVAVLIQGNLYAKIQYLEREVVAKQEKIVRLKKEVKHTETINDQKLDKLDSFNNKNLIKYNPSKSVASNIYFHAKAMSQQDFTAFYNKVSLSNPITLKKVQQPPKTSFPMSSSSPSSSSPLISQISSLSSLSPESPQFHYLVSLLQSPCKSPCCQSQPQPYDTRLNKAKTLLTSTFNKQRKDIYKNDKSQQYFSRYYRGAFQVQDVVSVSRTKMEEMDKIQGQYKRNLKARKKYEQKQHLQHRYSYSNGKYQ